MHFGCSFSETAPKLHHDMVQFGCSFDETAPKLHHVMVQFGGSLGAVWVQFECSLSRCVVQFVVQFEAVH